MKIEDLKTKLRELYNPRKIAVCTAWGSPFTWTHAAYNMMNLERPQDVEVKYFPGFGRDPARRHMWGVEKALEWNASHICFLGADQIHDSDILKKFVKHLKDGWPMVTALVPTRGWVRTPGVEKPFLKLAWKWKEEKIRNGLVAPKFSTENLELINIEDGDYQEVVVVGTGALIFDINLLRALKKPWFFEAEPQINAYRPASMDTTFVWRMITEAGGRMLCDCTINIIHLDVFPIDESYSERFNDWPRKKAEENLYRNL